MKIRISVLLWVFLLVSTGGPAGARAAIPVPLNISPVLIPGLQSPKALVRWLHKNIRFQEDPALFGKVDYWQTPEEFVKNGSGDCEDYALFAKSVLDSLGIPSYVVSFYGKGGYAHTVVIYEEDGRYNIINQSRLIRSKADTLEDALTRIYPQWTWGGIAEKRGDLGWLVFRLQNTPD